MYDMFEANNDPVKPPEQTVVVVAEQATIVPAVVTV
jgi:hypothetical protein